MWINLICDYEKKNYLVNLDRVISISKQCKQEEAKTDFLKESLKLFPDYSVFFECHDACLLYTSPSPRDRTRSRMPSSA